MEFIEWKKTYFEKIKHQLIEKYSSDELGKLLVTNKDRRISDLLCAAYNKKILDVGKEKFDGHLPDHYVDCDFWEKKAIEYFHVTRRAIGPGSWSYEVFNAEGWNHFVKFIGGTDLSDPVILDKIIDYSHLESLYGLGRLNYQPKTKF